MSESAPPKGPGAHSSLRGTETVLVVEDDAGVRKPVCGALASNGDVVMAAGNADEALRLSPAGEPATTPPGYADEVIVRHGLLDEGVTLLQKPFNIQDLLVKVRAVLDAPAGRGGM